MATPITIAILAGGESRRMGRDKALLTIDGGSLLERTARMARETGCPVAVVGRSRPAGWAEPGTAFYADRYPGTGPLGGIATALEEAGGDILALSCDLPLLTPDAIGWLLGVWNGQSRELGLAARSRDRLEPLFAIYRQAALPAIRDALAAGRLSIHRLLTALDFPAAPVPAHVAAALTNVNTPEEWIQATRTNARP
jgi:molybdopterin-guanine dinucleotide biosynthesis protein A